MEASEFTIVRVTQGDVEIMDFEEWNSAFSNWYEPTDAEMAIGQSTTFVVTRTK